MLIIFLLSHGLTNHNRINLRRWIQEGGSPSSTLRNQPPPKPPKPSDQRDFSNKAGMFGEKMGGVHLLQEDEDVDPERICSEPG